MRNLINMRHKTDNKYLVRQYLFTNRCTRGNKRNLQTTKCKKKQLYFIRSVIKDPKLNR